MNEVTQIHLGRQMFTIAVEAHKTLEKYLQGIRHEAGAEVADEVELRMAELLTEKGITPEKVVLAKDIAYLQTQLGEPGDFKDEDGQPVATAPTGKHLYRDLDHGMIAGVCAGLANYIGVNAWVLRIAFIAATLFGGWGIPLYILTWLLVPEAKSASDQLLMRGKPVTVDTLKHVMKRVNIEGAAVRTSKTIATLLQRTFRILLAIVGVLLVLASVALLCALVSGGIYVALNHAAILPFSIFPVGVLDYVLAGAAVLFMSILALLIMLVGFAMVRRKWQVPGWGVAALIGLAVACLAVGAALGVDAAPKIQERRRAAGTLTMRSVEPFKQVVFKGDTGQIFSSVEFVPSKDYRIGIRALGKGDTSGITLQRTPESVLEIDKTGFKPDPACGERCILGHDQLKFIVYAPDAGIITKDSNYIIFSPQSQGFIYR